MTSTEHAEPAHAAVFAPLDEIEAALAGFVDGLETHADLREAIRYALLGGGKRLRPLLVWHAAVAAGDPEGGRSGLAGATAVELVHAFSLVHDDLPAMDDDDLRRGRPTLHIHAGEAMAVLAGDAMLNLAYRALLDATPDARGASALIAELVDGTDGMIAGQVYDTLAGFPEGLDAESKLRLIHTNKTGALLRASVRIGAIAGLAARGAYAPDAPELHALSAYGEAIGLMYQIVDDLLDVEQTDEHLGKRAGKDQGAGKLTYPGVIGAEASRERIEALRVRAHDALAPLGTGAQTLAAAADLLAFRTK